MRKLAQVLNITGAELERLLIAPPYRTVVDSGKTFYPPEFRLRIVHDRVFRLLKHVETRPYHQSDKLGCSNVKNAGAHALNTCVVKTDIKRYFPSVSQTKVESFFFTKLQMSRSVAKALSFLLCKDGYLVKGSAASGFLAFWANIDMYDKIQFICDGANAKFTLYVDDLTFSLKDFNSNILRRVNGVIAQNGYFAHKCAIYKPGEEKIITGVILTDKLYKARKGTFKKLRGDYRREARVGAKNYIDAVSRLNSG